MTGGDRYEIEWRRASPYDNAYAVIHNGRVVAWTLTKMGARWRIPKLRKAALPLPSPPSPPPSS